ncbi:hypothetical protein ACI2VR_07195 [Ralstonia nicotianae]
MNSTTSRIHQFAHGPLTERPALALALLLLLFGMAGAVAPDIATLP